MQLFEVGDFTLASGASSGWKIECDALSDQDWDGVALMLVECIRPFDEVWGVPTGGVPFAKALKKYSRKGFGPLVVDDVWTTGGSMRSYIDMMGKLTADCQSAVLFARNPVPNWVTALFTMPPALRL